MLLAIAGCRKADVTGTWAGTLSGENAQKKGTTDLQADLQNTERGVSGTVTWHNSTGAWNLMEGETLTVRSSNVSGDHVTFMADKTIPGGTVSVNFKGSVQGTTMKGTADVNIGSVMGGDTYLSNFDLTRK
jgi:hypothetical protein